MTFSPGVSFVNARFIRKLNRFVGQVSLSGKDEKVYIPNTGRLSELLLPGSVVLLVPYQGKYRYKLIYAMYDDRPVMIESMKANDIVEIFIREKKLPGYEPCSIVRREAPVRNHRFDFLLKNNQNEEYYCEVKACTLAWKGVASFPDAVSTRAADHVRTLAAMPGSRVCFLLFHEKVDCFVPNYHTDYAFYRTLYEEQEVLGIDAFSVVYDDDYFISRAVSVPLLLPEIEDRGYCACLGKSDDNRYPYALLFSNVSRDMIVHEQQKRKFSCFGVEFKVFQHFPVRGIPLSRAVVSHFHEALTPLNEVFAEALTPAGQQSDDFACLMGKNPVETREFWDWLLEQRFGRYRLPQ